VNKQGGILAMVVPWSSVEVGDIVILGLVPKWRVVTGVEEARRGDWTPSRYIRADGKEFMVYDGGLATVMLDSGD
jgi:hypothetical protein